MFPQMLNPVISISVHGTYGFPHVVTYSGNHNHKSHRDAKTVCYSKYVDGNLFLAYSKQEVGMINVYNAQKGVLCIEARNAGGED